MLKTSLSLVWCVGTVFAWGCVKNQKNESGTEALKGNAEGVKVVKKGDVQDLSDEVTFRVCVSGLQDIPFNLTLKATKRANHKGLQGEAQFIKINDELDHEALLMGSDEQPKPFTTDVGWERADIMRFTIVDDEETEHVTYRGSLFRPIVTLEAYPFAGEAPDGLKLWGLNSFTFYPSKVNEMSAIHKGYPCDEENNRLEPLSDEQRLDPRMHFSITADNIAEEVVPRIDDDNQPRSIGP